MPRPKITTIATVLLCLALNIFGVWLTALRGQATEEPFHSFDLPNEITVALPPWARPIAPALYLFALTTLGIFAHTLWTRPKGERKTWTEWWSLALRPLLISPIVLYGTIEMAQKQPDAVMAGLFAFQNGFFWKTVLKGRVTRVERNAETVQP